jgi:hypothetical protein
MGAVALLMLPTEDARRRQPPAGKISGVELSISWLAVRLSA